MKNILLSTVMLLLFSCSTDDAPSQESLLPPITTTGENTFGCLVDGKYFRPRDGRITVNSDNKGLRVLRTENDNWEIHVYDRKSDKTGSLIIHLEDLEILEASQYVVYESNGLRGIDGENHNYIHGNFFKNGSYNDYLSFDNSGEIIITKKEYEPFQYHIFSGQFNAKLINRLDPLDTLKVELGRFDLQLGSLPNTNFD
ncbi:hypothetical protein [Nonlabens sp.]|uniref:hypothetical protein n=1 Tax=Nonlabens sp. TaxID=1888209 RepID=UPI003F699A9C